ncbi:MAG: group 1 truncated hemoglobin [Gammaproteobacteria bacterium]|nr:group 1 truncated hemoglobin [Gammaproteobacteria bacterium]
MSKSLFERLGGNDGITKIANDIIDNHLANKAIANRFAESDIPALKHAAATFFITGTGGDNIYKGKDMLAAHKGMNISALEFMAVLDDALAALDKNNIGQREQEEVLFILYSMRSQIVLV